MCALLKTHEKLPKVLRGTWELEGKFWFFSILGIWRKDFFRNGCDVNVMSCNEYSIVCATGIQKNVLSEVVPRLQSVRRVVGYIILDWNENKHRHRSDRAIRLHFILHDVHYIWFESQNFSLGQFPSVLSIQLFTCFEVTEWIGSACCKTQYKQMNRCQRFSFTKCKNKMSTLQKTVEGVLNCVECFRRQKLLYRALALRRWEKYQCY